MVTYQTQGGFNPTHPLTYALGHASYYLYYDYAVSLTTMSVQLHICNKQCGKMCSSKHCSEN